jgi:hypothetical protein
MVITLTTTVARHAHASQITAVKYHVKMWFVMMGKSLFTNQGLAVLSAQEKVKYFNNLK